ncbi:unnamed protein product [Dibothriocephalus latus]|uniref:Uncharacterized protein n=1 Tax=Dibothriocephalus latus TaxID=60516 RepID=A0A3P7MH11_DIBLA|nr:unnamed protein product [Dibothriocephalus latus]
MHNRNWLVSLPTDDAPSKAYKSVPLASAEFAHLQSQSAAFYSRLAQMFDSQSVCQLPDSYLRPAYLSFECQSFKLCLHRLTALGGTRLSSLGLTTFLSILQAAQSLSHALFMFRLALPLS